MSLVLPWVWKRVGLVQARRFAPCPLRGVKLRRKEGSGRESNTGQALWHKRAWGQNTMQGGRRLYASKSISVHLQRMPPFRATAIRPESRQLFGSRKAILILIHSLGNTKIGSQMISRRSEVVYWCMCVDGVMRVVTSPTCHLTTSVKGRSYQPIDIRPVNTGWPHSKEQLSRSKRFHGRGKRDRGPHGVGRTARRALGRLLLSKILVGEWCGFFP